jgi:hypothetical protein
MEPREVVNEKVDQRAPRGGKIRFVGGPLHNSLCHVRSWQETIVVCAAVSPDDTWQLCRYKLRTMQTPSCIWQEYHYAGRPVPPGGTSSCATPHYSQA